jgi:hypothetical protein
MRDENPQPQLDARLRAAGHDLPAAALADLAQGDALLRAMLARLAPPEPAAEPATTFRPGACR